MAGTESFFIDAANEFESDLDKIHKRAFAGTIAEANRSREDGGLMPVDTGELQNSIEVNGVRGKNAWMAGITRAGLLAPLIAIWNAPYAGFVDCGTRFQRPQPFARTAVLRWGDKVREQIRRL